MSGEPVIVERAVPIVRDCPKPFRNAPRRIEWLFGHRHYVVRTTHTQDDSLWSHDPNALDYCECGATRRTWGPGAWRGGRRES